jgi:hypothetical protein
VEIGTARATEEENAGQLLLLSCLFQRSRNAGFSCYNVMPLLESTAPPCLPLGIKDSQKEDMRLFALGFLLEAIALGAFALRLLL